METLRELLLVLDDQFCVVSANLAFYRTFRVTPRAVELQLRYHLCQGAWNLPELRRVLQEILPQNVSVQDFAVDQTFPQIGHRALLLNARRLEREALHPGRILLAMEDVTGQEGARNVQRDPQRSP